MLDNEFSALRLRAGLSVEELAEMTGYSPRHVYRWESGEGKPRAAALNMLKAMAAGEQGPSQC